MSTKPIPAGQHTVTPYLAIKNAVEALESFEDFAEELASAYQAA